MLRATSSVFSCSLAPRGKSDRLQELGVLRAVCIVLFCLAGIASHAQVLTTLASFNGSNGAFPQYGSLIQGNDGNLYGTTQQGGANGGLGGNGLGTIFKITPTGAVSVLYSFCSLSNCADGDEPAAGLVQGSDGNFYGTTYIGGANSAGTAFKVTPGGTLTTLYSFCQNFVRGSCTDGESPHASLVQGSDGNFYGTTPWGGTGGPDDGTVFQITSAGTLTTLYSFCSQSNCTDGELPYAGLMQGSDGNFYGTTYAGGAYGDGTVFKITPTGTLTTLYSFCSQTNCTDGKSPYASLVQGSDGNFYGTTEGGGASSNSAGTVFKITPVGALSVLYSFCSQTNCTDGLTPYAGLMQGSDGNFYGTTFAGGAIGAGTVFRITPTGTLTTLYSFCSQSGCADGAGPLAGVAQAASGMFYGTTSRGGPGLDGTVFSVASPIAVMTSPVPGSQFTGSTVTFTWTPGTESTAYWLDLGSTPGGNTYYQSGNLGNVLTTTVSGVPTNGSTVYATLWSLENGQWVNNQYSYTAANGSSLTGVITSPVPGSMLTGSTVTFSWAAGTGSSAYWIDAGSTPGGNQYFQSGNIGNVLSYTVTGLPTNGSAVYITLWSMVSGQWLNNQYTYTAFSSGSAQGVLTSPAPGSTLPGSAVTFGWTAGSGATAYWLDLGSVAGGNQYYQSGNLGNVLTTTVNGLPTNGTMVYATLYSLVGGQWLNNQYTYTAFSQQSSLGVMKTPTPGSTIYGATQTFTWNAGSGASAYWLDIGSSPGGNNYYQSGNLGNVLTTTANTLPANGTVIYVTLWSMVNGQWLNNQYTYTSAVLPPPSLVMSLLVDRSGSEAVSGGGVALQAAVPQFIQYFTQGSNYVSLITYASHSSVNVPLTTQFITPIDNAIAGLTFTGGSFGTGAGNGTVYSETNGPPLSMADYQNNGVSLPPGTPEVKAVVYFTDEVMNVLQDQFSCPGTTLMNYGGANPDAPGEGAPYAPELVFSLNPASESFNYCYDVPSDPDGTNGCNTSYLPEYQTETACTYNGARAMFPSQQYGTSEPLARYNVSNESQWRALYTANQMRSESPFPTYFYVIGLGSELSNNPCSLAFLATLANDPGAGGYNGGANCATGAGVYNPNLPAGLFLLVPNCPGSECTAELETAFQSIASKL